MQKMREEQEAIGVETEIWGSLESGVGRTCRLVAAAVGSGSSWTLIACLHPNTGNHNGKESRWSQSLEIRKI